MIVERCRICGGDHPTENCTTLVGQAQDENTATVAVPNRDDGGLGVGDRVGNYQVTEIIGEGATSEVFLGAHLVLGGHVAVKALRPQLHDKLEMVRRFDGEARATNLVRHDHILEILDIGLFHGWQHYIVMEYLKGNTLTEAIRGVPWPFEKAAPIIIQICDALNAAHSSGVIHRDLKPDNIYITRHEDQPYVKIVDFGSARRATLALGEQRTRIGTILGTAAYMAPEQAAGREVDARADVYSLGVIMFQLATGRLPFEPKSIGELLAAHATTSPPAPRTMNPRVGLAFESIILGCLAKSPDDRFQSMADVGRAMLFAQREPDMLMAPGRAASPAGTAPTTQRGDFTEQPTVRAPVRFPVSFPVTVTTETSSAPESMLVADISLGGAFLRTQGPLPPVFSRVTFRLPTPMGPVEMSGEVVRLEEPVDGRRGFAVRFDFLDGERLASLQALIAKQAPAVKVVAGDDPELARLLQHFKRIPAGQHYALLGIPPDSDSRAVREASRRLEMGTAAKRFPNTSDPQGGELAALRLRLAEAEEILTDPSRRAMYDAKNGNFMGVARCVREGLPVEELEELRLSYLDQNPDADLAARPYLELAESNEASGDYEGAMRSVAAALAIDALNLDLQRRYWALRRKAIQRQTPSAASNGDVMQPP
jgi:eukaryotic-like serine/threonine-protein kinase